MEFECNQCVNGSHGRFKMDIDKFRRCLVVFGGLACGQEKKNVVYCIETESECQGRIAVEQLVYKQFRTDSRPSRKMYTNPISAHWK